MVFYETDSRFNPDENGWYSGNTSDETSCDDARQTDYGAIFIPVEDLRARMKKVGTGFELKSCFLDYYESVAPNDAYDEVVVDGFPENWESFSKDQQTKKMHSTFVLLSDKGQALSMMPSEVRHVDHARAAVRFVNTAQAVRWCTGLETMSSVLWASTISGKRKRYSSIRNVEGICLQTSKREQG